MYLCSLSDATGNGPGRSDDDVSHTLVHARNRAMHSAFKLYGSSFILSLVCVDITF